MNNRVSLPFVAYAIVILCAGCQSTDCVEQNEGFNNDIFEDFLNNREKVYFCDTKYYELNNEIKESFTDQVGYTLDEIIRIAEKSGQSYDTMHGDSSVSSRTIDCGKDGEQELLLSIHLPGFEDDRYENGDEYENLLVVKMVDNKLYAKFYTESSYYQTASVSDYGYFTWSGPAYSGVGVESTGYLDADCEWHFYYEDIYYLEIEDFASRKGLDGSDFSSDKWNEVAIDEYYFDEEKKESVVVYAYCDDNGAIWDSALYSEAGFFQQAFDNAHIKAISMDRLGTLLDEKRQQIGLGAEIMRGKEYVNLDYGEYEGIVNGRDRFLIDLEDIDLQWSSGTDTLEPGAQYKLDTLGRGLFSLYPNATSIRTEKVSLIDGEGGGEKQLLVEEAIRTDTDIIILSMIITKTDDGYRAYCIKDAK